MIRTQEPYGRCVEASERNAWRLADVVPKMSFNPTKALVPEAICGSDALEFLTADEKLILNQVRGYSYANFFLFVEEFIVGLSHKLAADLIHKNIDGARAVAQFHEEELKHQQLFLAVLERFEGSLGFRPQVIEDRVEAAADMATHDDLAVLILTLMLEWITQSHYLDCFRDRGGDLDGGFTEVFRLHWIEEANHVRIDTLEIDRKAVGMEAAAIERSVEAVGDIIAGFKNLLAIQVGYDLEMVQALAKREFSSEEIARYRSAQEKNYNWTFIECGLRHPMFQKTLTKTCPRGLHILGRHIPEQAV